MKSSTLPYAARAAGLVGSVIDSSTSLLHKQSHDVVRFAMGSPAAEAVPSEILAQIAADRLSAPDAYDYAATEGDPPLHAALLEMLRGTSDETTADRLTITAGGMQGLDLFCKIFVDPGDLVTVESPTYTNGSATALSYGADLLEIPVDDDGMDRRRARATGRAPPAAPPRRSTPSRPSRTRPASRCRWSAGCGCSSWPGVGLDGDRRRPLRSAALRGRAAADAA